MNALVLDKILGRSSCSTGLPAQCRTVLGAVWSPKDLGASLMLWADAADSSTVTTVLVSGVNRVSEIKDKSGNNRHLSQPTANWRPNYITNGIGGRNAIQFERSRFTSLRNAFGTQAQPFTWAGVIRTPDMSTTTNSNMIFGSADITLTNNQTCLNFFQNSGIWNFNMFAGSGTGSGQVASNTDYLLCMGFNGASSVYGVNGGAVTVNPGTRSFSGFEVGAWGGGGNAANVTVGEVVVISRALTMPEKQLLDGYLAWKWGGP